MKNSKIHEGLSDKEIRDFLSLSIVKNYEDEINNKIPDAVKYDPNSPYDYTIELAEKQIIFYQNQKDIYVNRKSIKTLIKTKGWGEFDVYVETERDLKYKLHMSFIGTEEEYNNFIKQLKK